VAKVRPARLKLERLPGWYDSDARKRSCACCRTFAV
jgi:hypothetical protein